MHLRWITRHQSHLQNIFRTLGHIYLCIFLGLRHTIWLKLGYLARAKTSSFGNGSSAAMLERHLMEKNTQFWVNCYADPDYSHVRLFLTLLDVWRQDCVLSFENYFEVNQTQLSPLSPPLSCCWCVLFLVGISRQTRNRSLSVHPVSVCVLSHRSCFLPKTGKFACWSLRVRPVIKR